MVCIYCDSSTNVVNSRNQKKLHQVWRRRKCLGCRAMFTSIEKVELSKALLFRNSKGKIKHFQKEKLLLSIYSSLGHRAKSVDEALALTDTIVAKLIKGLKDPVVERDQLIDITAKTLKNFDSAAYVHYRAYFPTRSKST